MAALVGIFGGLALIGAKPRLPVARHTMPAPLDFSFVRSPVFVFVVSQPYRAQSSVYTDHTSTGHYHLRPGTILLPGVTIYPVLCCIARLFKLEWYSCTRSVQSRHRCRPGSVRLLLRQGSLHNCHDRLLDPFGHLRVRSLGLCAFIGIDICVRCAIRWDCKLKLVLTMVNH